TASDRIYTEKASHSHAQKHVSVNVLPVRIFAHIPYTHKVSYSHRRAWLSVNRPSGRGYVRYLNGLFLPAVGLVSTGRKEWGTGAVHADRGQSPGSELAWIFGSWFRK